MSSFFANYSYHPNIVNPMLMTPHHNLTGFFSKHKIVQQNLYNILNKSVLAYKRFADANKIEGPEITVDSWVVLNANNLKFKQGIKKLSPKFFSTFCVVKEINKVAFKLKLPGTWKFYPVFHCSLLCYFKGNELQMCPIL